MQQAFYQAYNIWGTDPMDFQQKLIRANPWLKIGDQNAILSKGPAAPFAAAAVAAIDRDGR